MENVIPRKIHYCWFGNNELSKISKKCISSWKNYCPDYEIIEWNEENFDINSNLYVKQAYQEKKWAFVTDYVRLKVLYDYGGVYMDTDVEMVKSIDQFLKYGAFTGFESKLVIPTGIIGAKRHHPWIKYLLEYYKSATFINNEGKLDLTPNVCAITKMTKDRYEIVFDNSMQILNDDIHIYPFDVFCAKNQNNGKIEKSKNTYTIHHFSGSWLSMWGKFKLVIKRLIVSLTGGKVLEKLIFYKNKF